MLILTILNFSIYVSRQYLCEFLCKSDKGYLIDCEKDFIEELLNILERYKLQSKVVIEDVSQNM